LAQLLELRNLLQFVAGRAACTWRLFTPLADLNFDSLFLTLPFIRFCVLVLVLKRSRKRICLYL